MRRLAVTLITLLFLATTAIAAIEEAPFDDIDQLIADSDIIVEELGVFGEMGLEVLL